MSKSSYQVWTSKPLFSKKEIESITKKATRWEKLKLVFHSSMYSFDDDTVIRYKMMDGKIYIMKKGTKL